MKICHITSAHKTNDVRIFQKECISLAKNPDYEVYLVGRGDNREERGVKVIGIPYNQEVLYDQDSRAKRVLYFSQKVVKKAIELKADVYHLHDPELLVFANRLKKTGAKVIFDSHEDVPVQILYKNWIPKPLRSCISYVYAMFEKFICTRIDAIVVPTEHIYARFATIANRVEIIHNYPNPREITPSKEKLSSRKPIICYAGGITKERGIDVLAAISNKVDAELHVAGELDEYSQKVIDNSKIVYKGILNRKQIQELYAKSVCGLVLLQPLETYKNSLPIKLYEYMSAGIPFVATNFPLWKRIADETGAGTCVDLNDLDSVIETVNKYLQQRNLAEATGQIGRKFIEQKFNWDKEAIKLINLYKDINYLRF